MKVNIVMAEVIELGLALGVKKINALPGAWEYRLDDNWFFAVNGHNAAVTVTPTDGMTVDVPPFNMAIWWNGWLAGIVGLAEGVIADHPSGANQTTFLEAVRKKKQEADGDGNKTGQGSS